MSMREEGVEIQAAGEERRQWRCAAGAQAARQRRPPPQPYSLAAVGPAPPQAAQLGTISCWHGWPAAQRPSGSKRVSALGAAAACWCSQGSRSWLR